MKQKVESRVVQLPQGDEEEITTPQEPAACTLEHMLVSCKALFCFHTQIKSLLML